MNLYIDEENRKLLLFHSGFTTAYLILLLLLLGWTGQTYQVGKYSFQFFLIFIVVAECLKVNVSNRYFNQTGYCIGKKIDSVRGSKMTRSLYQCKTKDGFKIVLLVVLFTGIYFVISLLYGAEMFGNYEETLMFSCLLSILTALPTCLVSGCNSFLQFFFGVKSSTKLESHLSQNVYLTLGGAWVGAMAIPLDWDRPWQVWPIPCSYGSIAGLLLSQIIVLPKLLRRNTKFY